MTKRKKPSAFKYGAYSSIAVLPTEDPEQFKKLHQELIADFAPSGTLEEDDVFQIACLLWRRRNLGTLHKTARAKEHLAEVRDRHRGEDPRFPYYGLYEASDKTLEDLQDELRDAEDQARQDLGETYALIEAGYPATFEGLIKELEIQDRFSAAIDKCLKRLLLVRGLKSISMPSASASPSSPAPLQHVPQSPIAK